MGPFGGRSSGRLCEDAFAVRCAKSSLSRYPAGRENSGTARTPQTRKGRCDYCGGCHSGMRAAALTPAETRAAGIITAARNRSLRQTPIALAFAHRVRRGLALRHLTLRRRQLVLSALLLFPEALKGDLTAA